MTTLETLCRVFGWQGGTIHQARQRLAIASVTELSRAMRALETTYYETTDRTTCEDVLRQIDDGLRLHRRADGLCVVCGSVSSPLDAVCEQCEEADSQQNRWNWLHNPAN